MLFDRRTLQDLLFLAEASLQPGRTIEAHIDPYEEIYFILSGTGRMRVGDEARSVSGGDAVWIPVGAVHELVNDGDAECRFLVVAGPMQGE